jgi:hypothetical protein
VHTIAKIWQVSADNPPLPNVMFKVAGRADAVSAPIVRLSAKSERNGVKMKEKEDENKGML